VLNCSSSSYDRGSPTTFAPNQVIKVSQRAPQRRPPSRTERAPSARRALQLESSRRRWPSQVTGAARSPAVASPARTPPHSLSRARAGRQGWTEAMQLMVEGDKWELYIPSEMAYGDSGRPPRIGGGDVLIFTIEILKIKGGKVPAAKEEM
jgi:hypothetical protein